MSSRVFRCLRILIIGSVIWIGSSSTSSLATNLPGELIRKSGDSYVRRVGKKWIFGTAKVHKEILLEEGHLSLVSFQNDVSRREYVKMPSGVFRFGLDGELLTGRSREWILSDIRTEILAQGELQFTIVIRDERVEVSKTFLIFPYESIIQEWLSIKNLSSKEVTLSDPFFLEMQIMQNEVSQTDFSYMTGGMCFGGSWILRTQPLTSGYSRNFDASDQPECISGQPCPKEWYLGTSIYAPIYVLFNRRSKEGVFVGWDYLGRWASYIGNYNDGPVNLSLKVSAYKNVLSPGSTVQTPAAFTGVFVNDLDDMGNQLLDYQYRYKWDYTRSAYFPAIRMLGYWWKGAADFDPRHPNMDVDLLSTFRKVFRVADLMRYVGADIYWRDYGWWNLAGDWKGPDFDETRRYLNKHDMKQTVYVIPYNADQGSDVLARHPEWGIKRTTRFAGQYFLNQAEPGVTDFELHSLERLTREWGNFEWRMDGFPLHEVRGDYSPMLAQDRNFRELVRLFLDRNPGSAFHGCNGGGNGLGYDILRMATAWQYSDGCVNRYRTYYTSYLFPPDKIVNMPDDWDPAKYETSAWRGLLWSSFAMTGDTQDPVKLDGLRQLIDIYHYLAKEGVVGRWVRIYHPTVTGDTPDWYLQRLSRDGRKGIIIPARYSKTPIKIFPKGLLPQENYNISYQELDYAFDRTGADLMANGIVLRRVEDGELIYLNLPMHPGSSKDRNPPSVPQNLGKQIGTNMDVIGVELNWLPATDDNWVSHYEILRNGKRIDKVAKGTYYFDHSAGASLDAQYEVRAVDGSGNYSPSVRSSGTRSDDTIAVDDSSSELHYVGDGWKHEKNVWAVCDGTQSSTDRGGDSVSYSFRGNRITWYGRLGPTMGRAEVYIDGKLDQAVDTYGADDIPNFAVYSRTFASIGEHEIRLVTGGLHDWRSGGNSIVVDGFQVGVVEAVVVEDHLEGGVQYGGTGWTHTAGWERASGGNISRTSNSGDAMEITFEGDGITWVGKKCPSCGKADVYVDGALDTIVDTFSPDPHSFRVDLQGGWQVPLYQKVWTKRGEHTVRIVSRIDKNMLSAGTDLYLDCFHTTGH
jgi:hypothetical protein